MSLFKIVSIQIPDFGCTPTILNKDMFKGVITPHFVMGTLVYGDLTQVVTSLWSRTVKERYIGSWPMH